MERRLILDDKVMLYRYSSEDLWQCSAYISGVEHSKDTKTLELDKAMAIACEWYTGLDNGLNIGLAEDENLINPTNALKTTHKILNGKVQIYRRTDKGPWHCSASFGKGRQKRKSTKETSLSLAKEVAEDWYLELKGMARAGQLEKEKTFSEAASKFAEEYEATTLGHRSPKWVKGHKDRIRLHLLPYFGDRPLSEISAGIAQEYRAHRMTQPTDWDAVDKEWKPPARNTLHNEVVTLSMILKAAHRHGWINQVPDLSDPYRKQSKVSHRPWFTPNEYKQLYKATRHNAANPKNKRFKWYAEQLHDFVLFMANTGLRPDEVKWLQFRDVTIVDDDYSGERILEIEVHGKRGTGYCKSMPGAVIPFERLLNRKRIKSIINDEGSVFQKSVAPELNDKLFPNEFKKMFNNIMLENDLKFDRHGKPRTAYSLRHSYICFRLLEGADIYQVAKNCRTSVEMIEKHYAAHLKDMIDTSLVNVRKSNKKAD